MTASCKWSSHITIKSMRPNEPSKHSRRRSLQHLQQRTVTSPSNCGINLPCRLKTHSTCCVGHESTRQNQRTKYSTDHTIGTVIPLHHWDARPLNMKTATRVDHGLPEVWMHSTWVRQKIIKDAIIITYQKRTLTISQAPPNCSHNIANSLH